MSERSSSDSKRARVELDIERFEQKLQMIRKEDLDAAEESKKHNEQHSLLYIIGDDPLKKIFVFLGDGHYAFISGVSQWFRDIYIQVFNRRQKYYECNVASDSISLARFYFDKFLVYSDRFFYGREEIIGRGLVKGMEEFGDLALECGLSLGDIISRHNGTKRHILVQIAMHGHLHILKYLKRQGGVLMGYDAICNGAAVGGHVHILEWVNGERYEIQNNKSFCHHAAWNGHLHVLEWALSEGYLHIGDERVCESAAACGQLDILQWCREQGCIWDFFALAKAVRVGNLDLIKYCIDEGCPTEYDGPIRYNINICEEAAKHGNLDVLKYLRSIISIPWGDGVTERAAKSGHLHILKYAHENGCPWDPATLHALLEYCEEGVLNILKYAHKNGCPWDGATYEAAQKYTGPDKDEIMVYLQENNCPKLLSYDFDFIHFYSDNHWEPIFG